MASRIQRSPEAFALSGGPKRRERLTNASHLHFVRTMPCLRCKKPGPSHTAHIRMGELTLGKRETGMAEKPSDMWTVPLCERHHTAGPEAQHSKGERKWWDEAGIDPIPIAALLYCASTADDYEAGRQIVVNA